MSRTILAIKKLLFTLNFPGIFTACINCIWLISTSSRSSGTFCCRAIYLNWLYIEKARGMIRAVWNRTWQRLSIFFNDLFMLWFKLIIEIANQIYKGGSSHTEAYMLLYNSNCKSQRHFWRSGMCILIKAKMHALQISYPVWIYATWNR